MQQRSDSQTSTARRIFLLAASLAVGAVGWFLLGETETLTAAERPRSQVVARVDGVDVTAEEVAGRAARELRVLEERRRELLEAALRGEVRERLVEAEARRRGVGVEELLEAEAAAGADLEAFYRRLEVGHDVEILRDPAGAN